MTAIDRSGPSKHLYAEIFYGLLEVKAALFWHKVKSSLMEAFAYIATFGL
jgi:hypothetical protein